VNATNDKGTILLLSSPAFALVFAASEAPTEAALANALDEVIVKHRARIHRRDAMGLILLLVVLVLLFGGGGFYMGPPYHYYGGGLGTILVIVIVVLLLRG
jgi:hypothetical protein